LRSGEADKTIEQAKTLVLRQPGWSSHDEAEAAGRSLLDPLARVLSALGVGADLGERAAGGAFTEAGLKAVENAHGKRALNDFPGLTVFETDPAPLFVSQRPTYVAYPREGLFEQLFSRAIEQSEGMSDRERVAFQLFSTSFFEESADTRLLTLMMAVEALLEPAPRPKSSLKHVEQLIELTRANPDLSDPERASILGSLGWLRSESIGQAGRRIAQRLEPRTYDGRQPKQFFDHCYGLRSALAHGKTPLPSRDDVDRAAASLERFVGHLLAGRLLNDLPVEAVGANVARGLAIYGP
jgi:hypothetical protein